MPIFMGYAFNVLLQGKKNNDFIISKNYIIGYLLIWSTIEVVSIPVTLLKVSYIIVIILTLAICVIFVGVGLCSFIKYTVDNRLEIKKSFLSLVKKKENIIGSIVFLGSFVCFLYMLETTYFFDEDDSRFVVNAIDIVRTNRILATDPTTGLPLSNNYDDFHKDLIGQWASFLAFPSKIFGLNVTIFAHIIYPVIASLLLLSVLWQLFDLFDPNNRQNYLNKCLMETVAIALYSFGYYSLRAPETFTIIRVWQGKATLASIGILILIMISMIIYYEESYKYGFTLLFLAVISTCLMTSMGVIISGCLVAVYGAYISFIKKDIRCLLLFITCCIPLLVLFLLSKYYTLEMFLS